MRNYKQPYMREFVKWVIANRLQAWRIGSLFLVWGWEDRSVALVAVRKSNKYIVRYKHRRMFAMIRDAIFENKLKFCRWDVDDKMKEYDISTEPTWTPPEKIKEVDD